MLDLIIQKAAKSKNNLEENILENKFGMKLLTHIS